VIDLPAQLDPLEIEGSSVTGRWRGESDVHFVRSYALTTADEARLQPAWLTSTVAPSGEPAPTEEEFMTSVRDAIKRMAMAQEIHYASHMTYTVETDSLKWERPEGTEVHFAFANARGWTALFTHPALDRVCALAYGFDLPGGWLPGRVTCSPAPDAAAATGEANR
jgi:hypothetical protein